MSLSMNGRTTLSQRSLRIISAPASFTSLEAPSTRSILLQASGDGVSRLVLEYSQRGCRTLIVAVTGGGATASLEDAATSLQEALKDSPTISWNEVFTHNDRTYFAVLNPVNPTNKDNSLEEGNWWRRFQLSRRRSYLSLGPRYDGVSDHATHALSLAACVLFLLVATTLFFFFRAGSGISAAADNSGIQYEVGSSSGPKYSHLLTPDNITEWADVHYDPAKYYIRIDEQALVPIELLDEQEMRYQQYLTERYPEKAEMRDSQAWLDPEFFHEPNNFMLPTDDEFHRGHCLRALRRYWQAKETGRHVCPWDIDYKHIHHCFSMLEGLMLPPGPRNEVGKYSMSWRTKVCSWES